MSSVLRQWHPQTSMGQGLSNLRINGVESRISGLQKMPRWSFSTTNSPAQRVMRGDQTAGGATMPHPARAMESDDILRMRDIAALAR
jgi:hypothetical protein